MARKQAGLDQNRAEAELTGRSSVFNPTSDFDPEYNWVRQPKVQTFEEEGDLANHLGLSAEQEDWLKSMLEKAPDPGNARATEFYNRLRQVMSDVPELDARDLAKHSQWGLDRDGKPVLIDYGFRSKAGK